MSVAESKVKSRAGLWVAAVAAFTSLIALIVWLGVEYYKSDRNPLAGILRGTAEVVIVNDSGKEVSDVELSLYGGDFRQATVTFGTIAPGGLQVVTLRSRQEFSVGRIRFSLAGRVQIYDRSEAAGPGDKLKLSITCEGTVAGTYRP